MTETLEGGIMLSRCDHGSLVPYTPALLAAAPCNHMIALCGDGSRWESERLREADDADAFGVSEGAQPSAATDGCGVQSTAAAAAPVPYAESSAAAERRGVNANAFVDTTTTRTPGTSSAILHDAPSLLLFACQAANYSWKYLTKPADETDVTQNYLLKAINCRKVDDFATGDDKAAVGKAFITRLANIVHGKCCIPATLAAQYLLKQQDSYLTHQTAAYCPHTYVVQMRDEVAPHLVIRGAPYKEPVRAVNVGDSIAYVAPCEDYKHRNAQLREMPPYFYVMLFEIMSEKQANDRESDAAAQDAAEEVDPSRRMLSHTLSQHHNQQKAGYLCKRFPVAGTHVQAESRNVAMLRTHPLLPQATSNFAVRPESDAPQAARELYALTMLSLFMSDCLLRDLMTNVGCNSLEILAAWETYESFDVLYALPDGLSIAAQRIRTGRTLLDVLQSLKVDLGDVQVPDTFTRWHLLGHNIVGNIDGLAAAYEEDRRTRLTTALLTCYYL